MNTVVTTSKKNYFPWGIEVELTNERCIYISAQKIVTHLTHVDIVVNKDNVISIPKESIRKLLIMGSNEEPREPS